MIYFPRNEVVTGLAVGVDDDAVVEPPTPFRHAKPVVFYGSSITEGGCCSKPANAYSAFLSRWLDFDCINLGFSGAARGEPAMADFIATLDMSVFVLDYDHPQLVKKTVETEKRDVAKKECSSTLAFTGFSADGLPWYLGGAGLLGITGILMLIGAKRREA